MVIVLHILLLMKKIQMKKIDLNKLSKLDIILITLIIFSIGYVIGYFVHKANSTISSPVEIISIDSLNNTNKDIYNKIKQLDSIKNEKVIEVKSLDNDSTLRLFYQLIGK